MARVYRHPYQVHQALEAGATWEQIAMAAGIDEAAARAEYREFAEGQHRLWTGELGGGAGRFGMDDEVHLQDGKTRSCGCLAREVHAESLRSRATTHGLSRHALFHTWAGMLERCENPDHEAYARYGARGITVCPEWHDVAAFITWIEANLGPRPEGQSLDRKDNDLGYLPGNVRWADSREQSRNSTRYGLTAAGRQARDRQIAKLRAGGMSYAAIGRQMGGAS